MRQIWTGPKKNCFYYVVKNRKHPTMSAWIVRFTDDPLYEAHVRQIACSNPGNISLIESSVGLFQGLGCKRIARSRVEEIREKLRRSHPQKSLVLDARGNRIALPGTPINEGEIFK